MAAYAAVVSAMYIINQLQNHHHPPISLDKSYLQSLTKNLTLLQDFFEGYSLHFGYTKEAHPLEIRIADAAYAAEDVIESQIVDQIHTGSINHAKRISSIGFYQSLQRVIDEMDSISKDVIKIKETMAAAQTPTSSRLSSSMRENPIVGIDDVKHEMMDKLIRGQPHRQIIPIVGMAGIGKTTLANSIYQDKLVVRNFDILAWVTITQEYGNTEILSHLLQEGGEGLSQEDEHDLGYKLYKKLFGRRYLIVMDDIWDIKVWEQLRRCFPDNQNGSRIVLTSRMSNFQLSDSNYVLKMGFLDKENSWILFSKIVFKEESFCTAELKQIGEGIVENCRGLPLSIVVDGGLLAKCEHTREYWIKIEENLNSIVNSEDNEHCLKVLHMSYTQLPVHLKPCFLYMGVFPEDEKIHVSKLVRLWVAEGFLKPIRGKSLEETAREYLIELVDRNMVLVHQLGYTGNIKYCKVHDLLRDLCLREAQKESFYNVILQNSTTIHVQQGTSTQRRVVVSDSSTVSQESLVNALQSMSLARSLTCSSEEVLPLRDFRLMRIMPCSEYHFIYFLDDIFQLVNARYLTLSARWSSEIPSSVNLLWNLQTLDVVIANTSASFDIWSMPQLRRVVFVVGLHLPDPPSGNIVLENLQKLSKIINFKCTDEVVKRIPNVKKLVISYDNEFEEGHLDNLGHLHKLESLYCRLGSGGDNPQNLTFPHLLKKLTFEAKRVHYLEDVIEKIGSLASLQKLRLLGGSFRGRKWETVEGQFRSLKHLQIQECYDMELWTTESTHFPHLEHLGLSRLKDLKEIPSEIGEMTTLKSIKLEMCCSCAIISARKILDDQEEFYGEVGIQVKVVIMDPRQRKQLGELASPNFRFV